MIETFDLRYRYASGPLMHFADVQVPQGGTLVLRGPSGSGKSTWLALAAGLRRPTAGEIVVAGQALSVLPAAALDGWRGAHVGVLPQRLHLSAGLSVADNLALVYWAASLAVDRPAIGRALAALGVADLAARRPHELSVGQSQRVALARAVLRRPRVLLVDEPTASLDDAACAAALDLIQSQARACEATLVVATHDARIIERLAQAQFFDFSSHFTKTPASNGYV